MPYKDKGTEKEYQRKYHKEHQPDLLASHREYNINNKVRIRESSKEYYKNNRETIIKNNSEYSIKNRAKRNARNKVYESIAKGKMLSHYGNGNVACALCGHTKITSLSLDHINGGGTQHRKSIGLPAGRHFYRWIIKNNYPDGFRVLCMNCQFDEMARMRAGATLQKPS